MSGWEILIILLVALLVLSPKQLPTIARSIGRYIRYFKNHMRHIQAEIEHGDLKQSHHEVKTDPKDTTNTAGQHESSHKK